MKILFVSSWNRFKGLSPIVKSQGDSLERQGVDVDYFEIRGKGIFGYLGSIPRLRRKIQSGNYNTVHAHYYLSGIVGFLAGAQPLIVSLMGSEARSGIIIRLIIRIFYKRIWDCTIVKSKRTKDELGIGDAKIIPNGVNLRLFSFIDKQKAKKKVGFDEGKYVLFMADPSRKEKNFKLAEDAFRNLSMASVKLHVVYNISHDRVPEYMYAADVLLLTSLWEGSPNVIKEAMYCGLPVVATDVGDVREIIGGIEGCYIAGFEPVDVAKKLKLALEFKGRTTGSEKIELLDDKIIASKLISIYADLAIAKT